MTTFPHALAPLEKNHYPSAYIQYCDASPIGNMKRGGASRQRLCFTDQNFSSSAYRIAVKTKCLFCCSQNYYPFTVLLDDSEAMVWLHKKSFQYRFWISDSLAQSCSDTDSLFDIFRKVQERTEKDKIPFIKTEEKITTYVCPHFTASKVKKSFIQHGTSAKVKKAKTEDGTILARRVATEASCHKFKRTILNIQRLAGKPGVMECYGIWQYTSNGQCKLVTLHPLYEHDLYNILKSDRPISRSTRMGYVHQLLTALESLGGDHGDLKPENICIKGDQLVLIDFEYFVGQDEPQKTGNLHWNRWSPPEYDQRQEWGKGKMNSWAAGFILYYLFGHPKVKKFPFHAKADFPGCQEAIDRHLRRSPLSKEEKTLVGQLVKINPDKRITIKEALDYFNMHIAKAEV